MSVLTDANARAFKGRKLAASEVGPYIRQKAKKLDTDALDAQANILNIDADEESVIASLILLDATLKEMDSFAETLGTNYPSSQTASNAAQNVARKRQDIIQFMQDNSADILRRLTKSTANRTAVKIFDRNGVRIPVQSEQLQSSAPSYAPEPSVAVSSKPFGIPARNVRVAQASEGTVSAARQAGVAADVAEDQKIVAVQAKQETESIQKRLQQAQRQERASNAAELEEQQANVSQLMNQLEAARRSEQLATDRAEQAARDAEVQSTKAVEQFRALDAALRSAGLPAVDADLITTSAKLDVAYASVAKNIAKFAADKNLALQSDQKKIDELRTQLKQLGAEKGQVLAELRAAEEIKLQTVAGLQLQISNLEQALTEAQRNAQLQLNRVSHFETEKSKLQKQLNSAADQLSTLQTKATKDEVELQRTSKALEDTRTELDDVRRTVGAGNSKTTQLNKLYTAQAAELTTMKGRVAADAVLMRSLKDELDTIRASLTQANVAAKQAEDARLAALRQVEQVASERNREFAQLQRVQSSFILPAEKQSVSLGPVRPEATYKLTGVTMRYEWLSNGLLVRHGLPEADANLLMSSIQQQQNQSSFVKRESVA